MNETAKVSTNGLVPRCADGCGEQRNEADLLLVDTGDLHDGTWIILDIVRSLYPSIYPVKVLGSPMAALQGSGTRRV